MQPDPLELRGIANAGKEHPERRRYPRLAVVFKDQGIGAGRSSARRQEALRLFEPMAMQPLGDERPKRDGSARPLRLWLLKSKLIADPLCRTD